MGVCEFGVVSVGANCLVWGEVTVAAVHGKGGFVGHVISLFVVIGFEIVGEGCRGLRN